MDYIDNNHQKLVNKVSGVLVVDKPVGMTRMMLFSLSAKVQGSIGRVILVRLTRARLEFWWFWWARRFV